MASDVPNGCGFSGERDGDVTSQRARRILDQRVEEELRRPLEQRIDRLQVGAVAVVLVALEENDRQPGAAGWPQAPLRPVDRRRRPPQIGVVMRDPAAGAVHLPGRSRPGDRQILDQRRHRIHRLLEVRGERRPVVHLGVDVDRVLAAPRRREAVVPDPLQVGRLRAGTRAGDEQVAGVVEVERRQGRIAARGERGDTLVDGHRRARRRPKVERDAIEELAMVPDVGVTQRLDWCDGRAIEGGHDRRGGVTADVVEASVARGRGDEQRDRVGAADDDGITGRGSRAAARQHANAPLEAERTGHRLSVRGRAAPVAVPAAHHQIAVRRSPRRWPAAASTAAPRTRFGPAGSPSGGRRSRDPVRWRRPRA